MRSGNQLAVGVLERTEERGSVDSFLPGAGAPFASCPCTQNSSFSLLGPRSLTSTPVCSQLFVLVTTVFSGLKTFDFGPAALLVVVYR